MITWCYGMEILSAILALYERNPPVIAMIGEPHPTHTPPHRKVGQLEITLIFSLALVWLNTLRLRQNGCHFADETFKRSFLNENVRISTKISLAFLPTGPINNIPAMVQKMAWHWPGDKPLSEPMMVRLPTHICVTRPQWVKEAAKQ